MPHVQAFFRDVRAPAFGLRGHRRRSGGLASAATGIAVANVAGLVRRHRHFLVLAWWLAVEFDAPRTRLRAQAQDQSGWILFILMLLSTFISVGAIALMLQHVKDLSSPQRLGHLALSMAALASSWLLMQTIFAFRYAHLYYQSELHRHPQGAGLEFPGKLPPDYFDFLYYAHVVGMTSQVSDVVVTSRQMRRLTLLHSLTAFAFNMLVLALSINVMAGAIQ